MLNGLDRVAIEEIALSDREGVAHFNRAAESLVIGAESEDVRTTTLQQLVMSHKLDAHRLPKDRRGRSRGSCTDALLPIFGKTNVAEGSAYGARLSRTLAGGLFGFRLGERISRAVP